MQTPTAAITGENLRFATDPGSPDWLIDAFDLDVRITATTLGADQAVFIGIAPQSDLDRYLADVAHDRVTRIDNGEPVYRRQGNTVDPVATPAEQTFWVAQAAGAGTQELTWSATSGRWAAVVMNADGSPGVSVRMTVGARSDAIVPLALVLAGVGVVLTAVAVVLIVYGASGARRRDVATTTTTTPASNVPHAGASPLPPPNADVAQPTSREEVRR